MRRLVTWLLAGAVAALGLAAAVDALRGDDEPADRRGGAAAGVPAPADGRADAVSQLRAAGVAGVLTYSDEDCRVRAVSLPELEPVARPSFSGCRPPAPPGRLEVVKGRVVGTTPGGGKIVLAPADLTDALSSVVQEPGLYRARSAAALGGDRVAVLVQAVDLEWERRILLFEGERFVGSLGGLVSADAIVRPSPLARYVAVLNAGFPGLRVFTREGMAAQLPNPTGARAIAWSPDERLAALATRHSIYVFTADRSEGLFVRIPLAARDLDWSE